MPGEFAEGGQILELGFEVPDVGLIQIERNALIGGVDALTGLADTATRRVVSQRVTDAAVRHRRPGGARVEEILIPRIELVFLDVRRLILEERAADPVEQIAGLGGQAQFLRPQLIVEQVMPLDEGARILAVEVLVEREARI